MSDNNKTHELKGTDDRIAYTDHGRREPYRPSRRCLLESLTVGGSVLLAGCGQVNAPDLNATETGTSATTGRAVDQTFRAPIRGNIPNKTSFFFGGMIMHGSGPIRNQAYGPVVKEPASWKLRRFLRESGVWVSGKLAPTPETHIQYNWVEEPMTITPTEVTLSIRDDAKWSDGHPVTGKDLAYMPLRRSLEGWASLPQYAPDAEKEPQRVEYAFDEFHVRDKSVTYKSSDGYFADFWDTSIVYAFGWLIFPTFEPTHVEPFDSYTDDIIEMARRAQAGEISPWYVKSYRNRDEGVQSLVQEHLTDPKWVEKFTKPENVLSTGPWDLVEMEGTEFRFAPNSHHRHAGGLNFDSFVFEFTESPERVRAALKADELDYGSPGITPKAVVDSFPESIKEVRRPAGGDSLQVNFDHAGFQQREVRLALLYALNRSAIATNIHRSLANPVNTPGAAKGNDFASQDWIDQNLSTYPQDRQRAAALMRDAGYRRNGGQWTGPEGTPFTLTLTTPSSPPKWEPTVASQLSKFGIDTTVQTLDPSVFIKRRRNGEFDIWAADSNGFIDIWLMGARKRPFMIYPDEQYEKGEFTDGGVPKPRSNERWSVFTLEAPPVGEPDGPLQEYSAGIWALSRWTNPPREEYIRRIKKSMWLYNWFLPTIPLTRRQTQRFVDAANWEWPTDSATWQSFLNGDLRLMEEVLRHWGLRANPNNSE